MTFLLRALIWLYRHTFSALMGRTCRFEPTCSAYSLQALEQYGAAVGSYMTVHRLLRCHPWCEGGHDPVPAQAPRLFSRLLRPSAPSASSEKKSS